MRPEADILIAIAHMERHLWSPSIGLPGLTGSRPQNKPPIRSLSLYHRVFEAVQPNRDRDRPLWLWSFLEVNYFTKRTLTNF